MRAYLHAKVRVAQFWHDNRGLKPPSKLSMHPRVFRDLLGTMDLKAGDWLDLREDGYYLMDVKLVEDASVPGIEMLVE